ncbi:hypothetical protein BO82DRAFT_402623 [Aspergillus uvarum CBS 121591]|uniref:Uncharacterized protein n=1 Tax=Aspergillus uvarum CBS 121591 TaxID=1448315 RepID=A0A319CAR5_9EURO|nr:hypothetical protein BO82DRAFT_402623 [Aspergillus uvarum CBS 121591]PYH81360.1 hypothetical protein BO82DRAFT_402623 [Aspergillus uvarum CBS 121591]
MQITIGIAVRRHRSIHPSPAQQQYLKTPLQSLDNIVSSTTYLLTLPLLLGPALSAQVCPRLPGIQTFSITAQPGPANGRFTSCDSGFDSPKVQVVNITTYDWWYFDAIGSDRSFTNVDLVQISGTIADFLFAEDAALVATVSDGSSGCWPGSVRFSRHAGGESPGLRGDLLDALGRAPALPLQPELNFF